MQVPYLGAKRVRVHFYSYLFHRFEDLNWRIFFHVRDHFIGPELAVLLVDVVFSHLIIVRSHHIFTKVLNNLFEEIILCANVVSILIARNQVQSIWVAVLNINIIAALNFTWLCLLKIYHNLTNRR
jgi:hypothetical protein